MEEDDHYLYIENDDEALLRSRSNNRQHGVHRQGSLVRPERNRFNNPNNPHFHYARVTKQQQSHLSVQPSTTGVDPAIGRNLGSIKSNKSTQSRISKTSKQDSEGYPLQNLSNGRFGDENLDNTDNLRPHFKPTTLTRKPDNSFSMWKLYCYIITCWAPGPILALFGMKKKERQMAWREKIALISVTLYMGAIVAYITFGFTRTVCNTSGPRIKSTEMDTGYVTINGKAYTFNGSLTEGSDLEVKDNTVYGPWDAAGYQATFLFQNVNGNCRDLITPKSNCTIPHDDDNDLAWYFPCRLMKEDGSSTPNFTTINYAGWGCHTTESERNAYYKMKSYADIYYTWESVRNSSRNLVVYNGHVLDLDLLNWLETYQVDYPLLFDELKKSNLQGYDLSLILSNGHDRKVAQCLSEIIKVGEVDSKTIGCIASDVVLYVSLILVLAVVIIKFLIACYFRWGVARKQGAFPIDNKTMERHMNNIEDWSRDIYSQGPIKKVPTSLRPIDKASRKDRRASTLDMLKKRGSIALNLAESTIDLNSASDFAPDSAGSYNGMVTMSTQNVWKLNTATDIPSNDFATSGLFRSTSELWNSTTLLPTPGNLKTQNLDTTIIHPDIVQQPPLGYMPYDFPLIHTLCFVTCYSEDEHGLRTTLDSLATTDYPNSHKLLMIVCDGLVKGSGNDRSTPEIALSMMDDFVVDPQDVKPYSYVAVTSGSKRHNMAKIYAGFYKYNDSTVPPEMQQRVPVITIVKCGTPDEQGSAKPGNRGKRDSQVILMSFLQKITFDERMTELEFQLLKNIWQITGLMADFYETVLMVDADTKVFPDSLTHMIAEMVKDQTIMGLCGETKIANKSESWVTAIQVFEYFISHHQSKAFESVFGSVTCLPGCFSLYRIKAPKGSSGYWVPILANPDIVERYSDNVTDTLHKKNLLLLGEDRYLSSLMLRTFPKRKQVFVPKAACKTVVPNTLKVLMSQRRRWINSTVHNLFELLLIRDLCGTFCFSMQFVIGIELIGTMVLPVAICFTVYVIIAAIVSHPTPILTLVLLAVVLGLPGLIVILTATRASYLMWMAIYICALPIWNLLLPSYAYWKFDDFSWGDTRTVAGDGKGSSHDEVEGDFDHSKIKMRTWREFEREERISRSSNIDEDETSRLFA
ncbi:hypothetical protein KAFR_0F02410 [Kazachstania africana CBS 2517]|uniref:chitin synthase n=1 Tax=Kazachstania africana (strain ATCC 22294 / BCRC 22015 / CBS 2517 / CECT 1963 / NBRC 1671 / NRRL Y-8276) TaxID=1071382 RepID=H2AWT8_KAZAF|nr:hypothetical protein KAFR_0F02410 [Kazachstania africana CBS 2517]CCF58838.1 hypothetical protein KAFR_0F02410 [Kazachstania africana CBS 2517]